MHTKISPLTQAYARLAARADTLELPAEAFEVARLGFIDTFGVMLAGAHEPVVRVLCESARRQGGAAQSHCVAGGRLPAAQAALVNATAAHALDFDDFAFSNHPSAVLCPAILAAADAMPQPVPGERLLRAYILGYEVWADAFVREPDLYYDKGWHPTSVLGTLGSTVAACVVRGLDAQQTSHALALAASSAGGVFENFGTMAKPYHGGRASSVGLVAADLAACGMQASPTAIEGERGMLRAFSPAGRVDRSSGLHEQEAWRILRMRLNLKRFPVVGAAQRGIEAMLGWRQAHPGVDPSTIARIHIIVSQRHAAVMPYHLPQDALQAKFSLEFALVCALLHGQVGLGQLRDEVVQDAQVQALMARVEIETTEAFEAGWRDAAPHDQLWVHLTDGRVLASPQVRRPRGHADLPLTDDEVQQKFRDCAAHAGVPAREAATLLQQLLSIRAIADVRALVWP